MGRRTLSLPTRQTTRRCVVNILLLSSGGGGGNILRSLKALFRRDLVDSIEAVTDDDAYAMARTLARQEGIFAGKSSAANVCAALRTAERLGPGKVVVTVICDSGYKYLRGDLYR